MIRPILRCGTEILHHPARRVVEFDDDLHTLIDDMIQTMHAAPGVGLAAPQVGVGLRVFVADPSGGSPIDDLVTMVNPRVVEREGEQREDEGCLSLPGFTARVTRPARLVVRGCDRDGAEVTVEGEGLLARVLHHELDHLDGKLFVDRIQGLRREQIVRRVRKLQRTGKW